MRLLSRLTLVVGALLFAAPSLHAQMSFSVAAGASLPMGDAADGLKMGYNATVGLGFKPLLVPVGLRVEGMFNSFEIDAPAPADGSIRVMAVSANGTYTILPQLYAIGGVGMYNSKASTAGAESSSDLGFNIGAGINIPLTGFGTYLEARYHHIATDGASFKFLPITFGIRF